MSEMAGGAGEAAAPGPEAPPAPAEAGGRGEAGTSGLSTAAESAFNGAATGAECGGAPDSDARPPGAEHPGGTSGEALPPKEPARGSAVSSADFLPGPGGHHARDPKEDVRSRRLEQWQKRDLERLRRISAAWNDRTISDYRARSAREARLRGG